MMPIDVQGAHTRLAKDNVGACSWAKEFGCSLSPNPALTSHGLRTQRPMTAPRSDPLRGSPASPRRRNCETAFCAGACSCPATRAATFGGRGGQLAVPRYSLRLTSRISMLASSACGLQVSHESGRGRPQRMARCPPSHCRGDSSSRNSSARADSPSRTTTPLGSHLGLRKCSI